MLNNTVKQEFVNTATGELLSGKEIKELINAEAKTKQLSGLEKVKSKEEFKQLINNYFGEFMFLYYNHLIKSFRDEKGAFDSALAFRFLYLSTFIDYDNKLRWGQNFRNKDRGFMVEKDLKEVMNLPKPQLAAFKKRLISIGVIKINKDGEIIVNSNYCCKGKVKGVTKTEFIRVYEKGIQDLYLNSVAREHKRLGIFINLMPCLNIQHNILCHNAEEINPLKIDPLKIQDICLLCGKSINNAKRLESELLKISVGGKPLIMKHMKFSAVLYSVNPSLYYKGNNLKSLQALINLFMIEPR